MSKQGPSFWVVFTLSMAGLMRIGFLIEPANVWWDASVYQGMARSISSGGTYGAWEFFRAPLWPLVLSAFSWAGPHAQEAVGRILVAAASLGAVYAVYKTGRTITGRTGLVAATLLALSVPFLGFSTIPMTEAVSAFLVSLALFLFARGKWFFAGLAAGLLFLARFPAGLVLPAMAVSILAFSWARFGWRHYAKTVLVRGMSVLGGFLILAVPYFVSNMFAYGNALSPLVAGTGMITGFLWLYAGDAWYYLLNIASANPGSILALFGIAYMIVKWKELGEEGRRALSLSSAALVLFLLYFSSQPHKEFRYIVPAFPFVFLLAGTGFSWIASKWSKKWQVIATLTLAFASFLLSYSYRFERPTRADAKTFREFYGALSSVEPGTRVLSSTPAVAAFSPVRLVEGYNTWEQMSASYDEAKPVPYVAIDSCELHACAPGSEAQCLADRDAFIEKLRADGGETVYENSAGQCRLTIIHITK